MVNSNCKYLYALSNKQVCNIFFNKNPGAKATIGPLNNLDGANKITWQIKQPYKNKGLFLKGPVGAVRRRELTLMHSGKQITKINSPKTALTNFRLNIKAKLFSSVLFGADYSINPYKLYNQPLFIKKDTQKISGNLFTVLRHNTKETTLLRNSKTVNWAAKIKLGAKNLTLLRRFASITSGDGTKNYNRAFQAWFKNKVKFKDKLINGRSFKNKVPRLFKGPGPGIFLKENKRPFLFYREFNRGLRKIKGRRHREFSLSLKNSLKYNLETYQRSNQDTCLIQKPTGKEGDWVETGDLLADSASSIGGELAIGHNIIVAYMPWEGFNYEDAIMINERLVYDDIYTSIHIERYEITTKETKLGNEQITREIPDITENEISHLDKNGIAKIGSWVEEGDILVGKITPFNIKSLTPQQKLLYKIFDKELHTTKDSSLRAPKGIRANVINVNILARQKITVKTKITKTKKGAKNKTKKVDLPPPANLICPSYVHIYLAEKRKMQVGDKMAGRHGNKGIVSRILPRQDMPFLPDGTPIDIVLNPLGVPSRMNVGQIYECLLGLAGRFLGEHYKIPPFDESYGPDASRSFVLSKLYEARKKTGLNWLFDPNHPGKICLFDGRNSECFHQTVTVGIAYVLKLVHMVDDKLHARSTGPYSLVTQQPLRGRSKQGGQRLGEMEVWAIEGYGAAFVLSEMLTIKSDDMTGRQNLWKNLIENNDISLGSPESFKVLVCELQALCLDIGLFRTTVSPLAMGQQNNNLINKGTNITNKTPNVFNGLSTMDDNLYTNQKIKSSLIEIDSLLNLA